MPSLLLLLLLLCKKKRGGLFLSLPFSFAVTTGLLYCADSTHEHQGVMVVGGWGGDYITSVTSSFTLTGALTATLVCHCLFWFPVGVFLFLFDMSRTDFYIYIKGCDFILFFFTYRM